MEEDKIRELIRRLNKTTKSRYRAAERLERHHRFTQWTVSLLSAALIFIPLAEVFKVPSPYSPEFLNALQTVLAVVLLVYSLLLGQENFITRADRMHRCGVELGRLSRMLAVHEGKQISDEEYETLAKSYYDILDKYENHKPIDYMFTKLSEHPQTASDWPFYLWLAARAYVGSIMIYAHYVVATLLVLGLFYQLLRGMLTTS